MRRGMSVWIWGALLAGCFVDEPPPATGSGSAGSDSSSSTSEASATGSTGDSEAASASESGSSTGDTGGETSSGATTEGTGGETTGDVCPPCDAPPSGCYGALGECVAGECVYTPKAAGEPCDDDDACTKGESCDGAGVCGGGEVMDCARANATGTCTDGVCGGWTCSGSWENCDGDWGNGCEIPVGVANQCDIDGLNPDNGCWTAYCGSSDSPEATNFGTYFCVDCENCTTPEDGMVQWCSHQSGVWFPAAAGACNDTYKHQVCKP
ncbi:MAG: hypothetical protein KC486_16210 [Myxococcales bacterium]|nr:hypothetical protein [Myxococcales bacterium]